MVWAVVVAGAAALAGALAGVSVFGASALRTGLATAGAAALAAGVASVFSGAICAVAAAEPAQIRARDKPAVRSVAANRVEMATSVTFFGN